MGMYRLSDFDAVERSAMRHGPGISSMLGSRTRTKNLASLDRFIIFGPSLAQVGFGHGRRDPHHQSFELRIVLLNIEVVASFSRDLYITSDQS
jgi:hypothetical protein